MAGPGTPTFLGEEHLQHVDRLPGLEALHHAQKLLIARSRNHVHAERVSARQGAWPICYTPRQVGVTKGFQE